MAVLSLFGSACTNKPVEPRGHPVGKAGSATTPQGCLGSLVNSVTMTVRDMHFRSACQRDSNSGVYIWAFVFRGEVYTGSQSEYEKCIDRLATALNDNVPHMDIGFNERCTKKVKIQATERYMWAYEYAGVL